MVEESTMLLDNNQISNEDGDVPPQNSPNDNNHKTTTFPTTTTFKVVHEIPGNRRAVLCKFGISTVLAICVSVMLATVQDFQMLRQRWLWIVGGAIVALLVLEITQDAHLAKTELLVKVCPLGVQRSLRRYRYHHHLPLLLKECIQDCIILEKVGAFAVTTHVMFRIKRKHLYNNQDTIQLVQAFPHACLSFSQCHKLKNQIQASLEEVR
jgi:hypothetical protein